MTSGKVKLSFWNAKGKNVKVSALTMADSSVKRNLTSLTLANNNAVTDRIAFAVPAGVRYLKIEAAGGGVNAYTLAVPAIA